VEQLDSSHGSGVLAWTSPRGRTYLTTPGTADHTLDRLDEWATTAAHLTHQSPPAPDAAGPAAPVEPAAHDHGDDGVPPF
ncbi:hypothetical protein, partial [Isoptericola sp. NPDC019482]|uniref:hypothetical protein n=1 Tax=Isoptericola sp. NPDC019482 TaxID=3154688 RepID=UPI0034801DC3